MIEKLTQLLKERADADRAQQMEAYLRNKFPFFGVMGTPRKEVLKEWKLYIPKELSFEDRRGLILDLWDLPEREYQLVATEYMMSWPIQSIQKEDIDMFEKVIIYKSWWDTVDAIANHMVGKYSKKFNKEFITILNRWEYHESFWIHRTNLIFQLKFKKDTDLDLLRHFIHTYKGNKEFFIQKAIGWSLREISKHNPSWVKETVEIEQLKGLAYREAMKYVLI